MSNSSAVPSPYELARIAATLCGAEMTAQAAVAKALEVWNASVHAISEIRDNEAKVWAEKHARNDPEPELILLKPDDKSPAMDWINERVSERERFANISDFKSAWVVFQPADYDFFDSGQLSERIGVLEGFLDFVKNRVPLKRRNESPAMQWINENAPSMKDRFKTVAAFRKAWLKVNPLDEKAFDSDALWVDIERLNAFIQKRSDERKLSNTERKRLARRVDSKFTVRQRQTENSSSDGLPETEE